MLKGWREAEQIRPEDFHGLLPHWTAPGCILWGEFRNGLDAEENMQQKTEAHPEDMGACCRDDKRWLQAKPGPSLDSKTEAEELDIVDLLLHTTEGF